jgi:hypothetical protein
MSSSRIIIISIQSKVDECKKTMSMENILKIVYP